MRGWRWGTHQVDGAGHRPRGRGRHARAPWRGRAVGLAVVALLVAVVTTDVIPAREAQAWDNDGNYSISFAGIYGNGIFTPADSSISVNQSNQVERQALEISVYTADSGYMFFNFATRHNSYEDFKVGYYGDAQSYASPDPGRPGISISPLGFCSENAGNFEVRDIVRDGPKITRIWITFQRYCNTTAPADQRPTSGEIRIGYPKTAYDVSPRVVRWTPGTYPKESSYDVPVTVLPSGTTPVDVTSVAVTGPAPASFPIRRHNCTGTLGASGCVVWIGFTPTVAGPRYARLVVTTTAGTSTITLDGPGAPGTSAWTADIDHRDDRPDEHLDMSYSISWGTPYAVYSQASEPDGTLWDASFDPVDTSTLAQGGHYLTDSDGSPLRISMARGNAACVVLQGTTDIANLAHTGPDQRLAVLDLTTQLTCEGNPGDLIRARLRYQDRGDFKGPYKVTNVSAVRDGGYVRLSWTNPPSTDFARTVVRWYPGDVAPAVPDAGNLAAFGTLSSVRFAAPTTQPVAISIWAFDTTGNASLRYTVVVAP